MKVTLFVRESRAKSSKGSAQLPLIICFRNGKMNLWQTTRLSVNPDWLERVVRRAYSRRKQYLVVKRTLLRYELYKRYTGKPRFRLDIKSIDQAAMEDIAAYMRSEHLSADFVEFRNIQHLEADAVDE